MYLRTLLTAAAATAFLAGAAQAQTPPTDTANPPISADAMPSAMKDTAVNPPAGTMVDPGTKTTEATPATAAAVDVSATVTTSVVTNGPVADTPENRAKYGQPLSRAGRRTAARGN